MFVIVAREFMAPNKDENPAKWRLKMPRSTAGPEWKVISLKGGYTVQPVPTPISMKEELKRMIKAGGSNQNDKLFNRGYAISGAPS